ncbi:hypothetical protein GW17_00025754 [Ensete ventricosum]|nr:hypothetical protein GW17_00025754 [Ensete ventricosum]
MLALRNPMALAVICQNRGHSRLRLAVQKKMVRCEMGGVRSGHCGFDRGSSNRGRPMTQRPWLPVEQRGERVQILSPWLRQRKQRPGEADGSETMVADSDMMQGAAEDEKEEEATVASEGGKGVVEPMIGASKVVSLATSSSIAERVAEVTTARGKSSRHSAGSEVVAHVGEGAIPRLEAVGGHKPGEDVDREGNGAAGQLWRAEEDAILRAYVKQYGPREWNLVSQVGGDDGEVGDEISNYRNCLDDYGWLDDSDKVGPRREFARRFAEGIEKFAGSTPGDHRKKTE